MISSLPNYAYTCYETTTALLSGLEAIILIHVSAREKGGENGGDILRRTHSTVTGKETSATPEEAAWQLRVR